ncbi:MAG: DNRLRE domain-containing protein [archaeon]|nr:DNRLRE domain-containing protein [archaeon]
MKASEEPVTLYPEANAYVNSFSPDKNYGKYYDLQVEGNKYNKTIFIKFNLMQIPADASIVSAQLMLYGYSSNSGIVSVYYVSDDSWTENGITYNNRPSSSIYLTDKENVSSKSWCSWNIKEDVITALSDNKLLTEVMRYENAEDHEGARFFPRDCYNEDLRPKLVITYTLPASHIITPSAPLTPTTPPTETKEEVSWWSIIQTVAVIVGVILTYFIYRLTKQSRRKIR